MDITNVEIDRIHEKLHITFSQKVNAFLKYVDEDSGYNNILNTITRSLERRKSLQEQMKTGQCER